MIAGVVARHHRVAGPGHQHPQTPKVRVGDGIAVAVCHRCGFVIGALAQPDSRAGRGELRTIAQRAPQVGLQNRAQPGELGTQITHDRQRRIGRGVVLGVHGDPHPNAFRGRHRSTRRSPARSSRRRCPAPAPAQTASPTPPSVGRRRPAVKAAQRVDQIQIDPHRRVGVVGVGDVLAQIVDADIASRIPQQRQRSSARNQRVSPGTKRRTTLRVTGDPFDGPPQPFGRRPAAMHRRPHGIGEQAGH